MENQNIIARMQPLFDSLFMDKVNLSADLSAKEVPEWDSLMHISLVVAVEKEFGIRFSVGEVESTQNVGEFAALIRSHLQRKKAV